MDAYEATRIVFSRIQSLDPENASKIMGLLLIQDHGEKEMIRLAFGPEALVHSVVLKARKDLSLSSSNNNNNSGNITNITSSSTPSTPSSPFFSIAISRQNSSSSRMLTNLSPSSSSPSWVPSNFSDLQNFDDVISPNPTSSASYAAVAAINGFNNNNSGNTTAINNNNSCLVGNSSDLIDDFQLQDQLSFLNEAACPSIGPKNSDLFYPPPPEPVSSPGSNSDGMLFPSYAANWGACAINNGSHKRSSSVTDICMGAEPLGSGLGWKPCLYFARGYCKNGTSCRFLHGLPDSAADAGALVGSPNKFDAMEQCQELLLRSKTQQQQQVQQQQQQPQLRLSTQLMASASFPYSAAAAGKCMNFLLQQQQNDTQWAAAAALMLGDDMHKFGRPRIERNDFASPGGGMVNPGSRQIYLTFPADSTFREEDVSNYFSIYGPVQDVRIPYQQKRMFGFVTFVYAETVKLILAKGNPHFVCDARVLVKPYKEKGKVPDKYRKQQQQQPADRGDFTACTTPTGIDSRDPYDLQLGGRTFNNTQDFLRRKLEEQADLQQAIELQSRRFLGLQLLDVKKHQHHQRNLSAGAISLPSPTHHPFSPHFNNHASIFPSSFTDPDRASPETPQDQQQQQVLNMNKNQEEFNHSDNGKGNGNGNGNGEGNEKSGSIDDCGGGGFHSSLEHNLPDSPFASPKKSSGEPPSSISSTVVGEIERSNGTVSSASSSSSSTSFLSSSSTSNKNLVASSLLPATSTLDMASFKSCLLQVPRFSSGQGALGM